VIRAGYTLSIHRIEVRGEFINLTNTPILNAPTRTIGTTLGLLKGRRVRGIFSSR